MARVAIDGDEFPVLRDHINVVSGGVRVFGTGLRELIAAARKESADDDAVLVSTRRSGRPGYVGGC